MSLADVAERDCLAELGLLRFDDLGPLRVYSYTERCRYQRAWNDVTLNSRGIVFNRATGECVARPFPKFFMVGEATEPTEYVPDLSEGALPWDSVGHVFEKVDGYLGILYRMKNVNPQGLAIATRGCFTTPAAEWATGELARHDLGALDDSATLCFEIVHPDTRVIVDYAGREELVLLAAFDRHTGEEYPWATVRAWAAEFGFRTPAEVPPALDAICLSLSTEPADHFEGYVVQFQTGLRVKLKGAAYLEAFARRRLSV